MKKAIIFLIASLLLITGAWTVYAGEKAPKKVVELANSELAKLGTDSVIIEAVKTQNSKEMTLDQIKAKDEEWKSHAGIADYM
jgi:hypothetical protein